MGILRSGVFGGFSNKTGANIGRQRKGTSIVTGLYHPRRVPPTVAERRNMDKFSLLSDFLNKLNPLINIGFKGFTKGNTPLNAAYKFNYTTAFLDHGDHYTVDYPKIKYSKGNVCRACCLQITTLENALLFHWLAESQTLYNRTGDKATFAIYNVEKDIFLFEQNACLRKDLGYEFKLPANFAGNELHCYMNFNSADGKTTGESVYAGQLVF
jgi:hypothetical protein